MRGEVELLKQKQEDKFSTSLEKAYSDTYYTTHKHIADSLDSDVNFAKFDSETVRNAVYEKWLDGSNFSDRIWNDKQKLLRELNTNLVQGITRGDSPDKMIKNISARMNVSKSRSAALYQTEYTHIMVDARLRSIMDAGCDEYEIDENMDSDICSECASMHGKHFKLSEYQQGITAPPFHTRCRGTITAYFVDDTSADKTDESEEMLDKADNEISKSVDKSSASDIIKTTSDFNEKETVIKVVSNEFDLSKYSHIKDEELKDWKKACGNSSKNEYKQINKHEKADGSKGGYIRSHRAWGFNDDMRKGIPLDEDDRLTRDTIRKLCKENATDRNVILDRFVDADYLSEYGEPFNRFREDLVDNAVEYVNTNMQHYVKEEKSIVSASYGNNVLIDRDIHIRLHCDKGTHMFCTNNKRESEVLFSDGLQYEFIKANKETFKSGLFGTTKHRLVIDVVVKNNGLPK